MKKDNIRSQQWRDMLRGDEVHAPNTREESKSKIQFTLEQCEVDRDTGNVRTTKTKVLPWRT